MSRVSTAMLTRDIDIAIMSICLSVCLSATSTLVVPPTRRATLGDRAFPVAAARAVVCQGRSIVASVPPGTEDDTVSCVLRLKTALQLLLTIILYSAPATVTVTVSL